MTKQGKSMTAKKPHPAAACPLLKERTICHKFTASEMDELEKNHLNRPTQSDTTRATAASGEAGARNSPDKERAGISKGAGLAIEARSLLILLHETMRKPDKGHGMPFKIIA